MSRGAAARPRSAVPELLRLAWPAVLSYTLTNAYRINDQFWIQGLGGRAQAAIAATFFVQLMAFAVVFLAVGGGLALVARSTGARDPEARASYARHALGLGIVVGVGILAGVRPAVPAIVDVLELTGPTAEHGRDYLRALYLFAPVLVLFPVLDAVFIGLGNSRIPLLLQCTAIGSNYVLNPIFIYGAGAAEAVDAPGGELIAALAAALGVEGRGMAGAGLATGCSRVLSVSLGLAILRYGYGVRLLVRPRPHWGRVAGILRIGAPVSFSIAVYAGTYWLLFALVLSRLGDAAKAGLGIGFQVFEGVAFPCFLGLSIGTSSLVGRAVGARDPEGVRAVVRAGRLAARVLGVTFGVAFLLGGRALAPVFTQDPEVARQTMLYVGVLAFSQYWVAVEVIHEKILLGAGFTRPILWIGPIGNALRIPLGWLLALTADFGPAGLWWAINLTTYLKAFLLWRLVQKGTWLERTLEEVGRAGEQG